MSDLNAIGLTLRDHDPFRGKAVLGFDWYDPSDIISKTVQYGTEFELVLDRNALSEVISLASPKRQAEDSQRRLAAAVMAFSLVTGIYFDANVAVSEPVGPNGIDGARSDTILFASLQCQHAQDYIDIALGRKDMIGADAIALETRPEMKACVNRLDLDYRPRFRPEYGVALKLALIRLRGEPRQTHAWQLAELLRWSYEEFMFVAGAIVYGSLALSPARHRKMLKGLNSGDVNKALAGVRNAMWDMALLRYWGRRILREGSANRYVMVCSFDRAVLTCATDFITLDGSESTGLHMIRNRWIDEWGERDGNALANQYTRYCLGQKTDPAREMNLRTHTRADWDAMVNALETEFRLAASIPVARP